MVQFTAYTCSVRPCKARPVVNGARQSGQLCGNPSAIRSIIRGSFNPRAASTVLAAYSSGICLSARVVVVADMWGCVCNVMRFFVSSAEMGGLGFGFCGARACAFLISVRHRRRYRDTQTQQQQHTHTSTTERAYACKHTHTHMHARTHARTQEREGGREGEREGEREETLADPNSEWPVRQAEIESD